MLSSTSQKYIKSTQNTENKHQPYFTEDCSYRVKNIWSTTMVSVWIAIVKSFVFHCYTLIFIHSVAKYFVLFLKNFTFQFVNVQWIGTMLSCTKLRTTGYSLHRTENSQIVESWEQVRGTARARAGSAGRGQVTGARAHGPRGGGAPQNRALEDEESRRRRNIGEVDADYQDDNQENYYCSLKAD